MKSYSKYRFHVARIIACAALAASLSNCSDDGAPVATTPTNTSSTQPPRITYEHPMPPPVRIAGMAGFGLAGAAVCSDRGFAAIIQGSAWHVLNTGRSVDFNAVWGTSPNDFYVVGDLGCVLHWDGTAFTDIDTGYSDEFLAVWGASTDDVWLCARGAVVHWDGATATRYESPALPSGTYHAIHGSSSTNVYAVGFNGRVARWDGTSWSAVTTGLVSTTLNCVFVTGNEVFIGGSDRKLWHYDGTSWSSFTATTSSPFDDFSVVTGTGPSAVYALGQARLMYGWDGTNWSDISDPFFNTTYNFFSGYAYGVGLVAGGDYNAGSSNIAIFNSVSWAPLSVGATSEALWDAWTFDVNHAYAVGDGGTILERDAAGWSSVPHGLTTESLYTVWASSGSDVYAAGEGGVVLRFDGSSWATVNTGLGTVPLYDISGQGPNDVWIVGSQVLWHWDGVTWTDRWSELPDPAASYLRVYVAPTGEVTLGGDGLLRFDGTTWTQIPIKIGGFSFVQNMWGESADNIWIGEYMGTMQWDGSDTQLRWPNGSGSYPVVAGESADNVLAGVAGELVQFSANGPSAVPFATGSTLNAAHTGADGTTYFVGYYGLIVRVE